MNASQQIKKIQQILTLYYYSSIPKAFLSCWRYQSQQERHGRDDVCRKDWGINPKIRSLQNWSCLKEDTATGDPKKDSREKGLQGISYKHRFWKRVLNRISGCNSLWRILRSWTATRCLIRSGQPLLIGIWVSNSFFYQKGDVLFKTLIILLQRLNSETYSLLLRLSIFFSPLIKFHINSNNLLYTIIA